MADIIECNPEILGGKPIIKGTKILVALVYELFGLNYSIADILKEYPHLDRTFFETLLKIGKNANENLLNVDINEIISREVFCLIFLLDENLPLSIKFKFSKIFSIVDFSSRRRL